MRILIVTQYFWPENFRINELAIELKQRGHEITVLTGLPNYPSGKFTSGYGFFGPWSETYNGIRVVRSPLLPRGAGRGWQLALNYLSFAFFSSCVAAFRFRGKQDAIFVFEPSPITVGLPALVLKWLKRIPVVFWVQDLWPESLSATGAVRSPAILAQVRKLVRFIYRRCDLILAQSRAFIPEICRVGAQPERVRYYPNSAEKLYRRVEVSETAPERAIIPEGARNHFKILFAGNIGAAQDFETILNAATLLKDQKQIHWLIVGDGRLKEWVQKEVPKRGISETFHLLGRHPMESMPTFFGLSDALLVTLKSDPIFALTVPSKVQSYLACGKPIVAALDGEGAKVIEESGAGVSCPSSSPELLAEQVLLLSQRSAADRLQMSRQGLAYFKQEFDPDMLVQKLEKLMQEAISKHS